MSYLQLAPFPLLTLLTLLPLGGALLALLGGMLHANATTMRRGAAAYALLPLAVAIIVAAGFVPGAVAADQATVQWVERVPWTEVIRIEYFVGVDGLSLPLVLLTALLTPCALLASGRVRERPATYLALIFLLQTCMLGFFTALNFFFFFIFFELSLIPAFFLIDGWGQAAAARRRAATQFVVYTVAGSLPLLLLFQLLYVATASAGIPTLDLITLGRLGGGLGAAGVTADLQTLLFAFLDQAQMTALGRSPLLYTTLAFSVTFIAFAVKLAIWPLHTWLPDTYSEAPPAVAMLLAGVMSKMGAYGMLRIMLPLFPDAARIAAPVVAALALAGVLAGALGALRHARGDLRRMIAYTSINHMGYVGLAVAAAGAANIDATGRAVAIDGAVFQMIAHGLSTAALFLLAGMLAARLGTNDTREMGGLRSVAPLLASAAGIALFANLGLPGLAGFVGEFYIFRGLWQALPAAALLATIGLVITALALLRSYSAVFHGPRVIKRQIVDWQPLSDEGLALLPLLALLLLLGLWPAPLMDMSNGLATAFGQVLARLASLL